MKITACTKEQIIKLRDGVKSDKLTTDQIDFLNECTHVNLYKVLRSRLDFNTGVETIIEDRSYIVTLGLWKETSNGIDVDGDVRCSNLGIKTFPVYFNKVTGSFDCAFDYKTNLESCTNTKDIPHPLVPSWVNLESLEGSPEWVGKDFSLGYCQNIKSLKYSPEYVGGQFNCVATQITSLEHSPKYVGKDYMCRYCEHLKSAKGLPDFIGGEIVGELSTQCDCVGVTDVYDSDFEESLKKEILLKGKTYKIKCDKNATLGGQIND